MRDSYWCPVCRHNHRGWHPYGTRCSAKCPLCGALERHRLAATYLDLYPGALSPPARILHVAPERCMTPLFKRAAAGHGGKLVTLDLLQHPVHVQATLTALPFVAAEFDLVFCSHVLEHVPDDRTAMREVRRVLRPAPRGLALIMVPVYDRLSTTQENPRAVTPAQRLAAFGQSDHVRRYGRDFADRLAQTGFLVQPVGVSDLFCSGAAARAGLLGIQDRLYVCSPA